MKVKGESNGEDVIVSVCYMPPNQEKGVDKTFFKQLMIAPGSLERL